MYPDCAFPKGVARLLMVTALLLAAPIAAMGQTHNDMVWIYSQYSDVENMGRSTSQVIIGVPETDYAMGRASCFAGSTSGLPMLELAADTRGIADGSPIGLEFFTPSGPVYFEGQVKAPLSDEDYSGVRIQPDMADPIWGLMRQMPSIQYRVNGQVIDLPLRGSGRAIANLLADCRVYHGDFNPNMQAVSPQPVQPANQPLDPRWATCEQMGGMRSQNSNFPVTLTFVNQSGSFRGVLWIGFDGVPVDYAALNPGESFTINTFLTHPWMFTDGPGNCLEMFMPQRGVSVFNITAPNRDFGPE